MGRVRQLRVRFNQHVPKYQHIKAEATLLQAAPTLTYQGTKLFHGVYGFTFVRGSGFTGALQALGWDVKNFDSALGLNPKP